MAVDKTKISYNHTIDDIVIFSTPYQIFLFDKDGENPVLIKKENDTSLYRLEGKRLLIHCTGRVNFLNMGDAKENFKFEKIN